MSNLQRTQAAPQRRAPASKGPAPMETDSNPPTEPPKFTDYRLVAAFDSNLKVNILKFAPSSSDKEVNLSAFIQPVKLNRKDPWMIRKKAEEEKKASEMKLKNEVKDEDDLGGLNGDGKDVLAKGGRDESLVAPGFGSQPRAKAQPFKKKTKQVFIAADQTARMLRKEEYQSWLLEDGTETGTERWIGRYESAGAASGSSADASGSTPKPSNHDAPNYVVFKLDEGGENFQVLPCHRFYRFTQRPNYDTLGADEAEAAYEKMQKPTTKEDVGRWFMRRRGAGATAVAATASSSNLSAKREGSVKPSILDESKLSLGPRAARPQVEVVSHVNGRYGSFTAVHGANKNDDDEDEKPQLGQEGDLDEFDFNEDFADDEEGAGNLNDEAMEEHELKELEERMKKEMLAAGRAGDEERAKEDDLDEDNPLGEKEDLTKEGKAVKKLLMRKDNEVYDSDDDVKNPYASEDDESDFEEVIPPPPPPPVVPSPTDSKTLPSSRAGTPGASSSNPTGAPIPRNPSKLGPAKPPVLKVDKVNNGPSSRSGTPALVAPSNSISPRLAAPGLHLSVNPHSRANSPQPGSHSGKTPHSRAGSPSQASKPTTPTSGVGPAATTGVKRKYPGALGPKDKRPNSSTPGSPSPDQGVGLITEQEVIDLLRKSAISTKELLTHFKMRLKDERNKSIVFQIIKSVAQMVGGQLVLKDGL